MTGFAIFKNLVSTSNVLLALFSFNALITLNTSCRLDRDKKVELFVRLEDCGIKATVGIKPSIFYLPYFILICILFLTLLWIKRLLARVA